MRLEVTYSVPDLEYTLVRFDEAGADRDRGLVMENAFGHVSVEAFPPDGSPDYTTTSTYDASGLLIERIDVRSSGDTYTTRYAYEFDEVGNWTRRTTTEDIGFGALPSELLIREITYH